MKALTLAIALAGCGGWTTADTLREVAFMTPTTLDWGQTMHIVKNCAELNPIIGECGQRVSPGYYFPAMIVLHAAVAALLPPGPREAWQYIAAGGELSTIWLNYRNGVSF